MPKAARQPFLSIGREPTSRSAGTGRLRCAGELRREFEARFEAVADGE
jgi:hypothetical protein